jgi:hypothetical protein
MMASITRSVVEDIEQISSSQPYKGTSSVNNLLSDLASRMVRQ